MIRVDSLSIEDGEGNRLLQDMTFKIEEGETVLICGEPGSGKTLLLKAIQGIVSEGLKQIGDIEKEGKTGLLFQDPEKQMVRRKVRMEAAFDLENLSLPRDGIKNRIQKYASILEISTLLDKDINDLSHGERTQAALLSVLVSEPEILLLDEPLSSLDHSNQKHLMDSIERLKNRGSTIVIAEHDVRDLIEMSDRVLLVKKGRILKNCRPEEAKTPLYEEGVKLPFDWELDVRMKGGPRP
ncbi:MAG: ABC transporter ATP-binding protein [Candidatus Thermoplasmatota archaeon]|nr:ABC transporter ATP-binding protein [Candidatus Thermoplasmatota archaeon]